MLIHIKRIINIKKGIIFEVIFTLLIIMCENPPVSYSSQPKEKKQGEINLNYHVYYGDLHNHTEISEMKGTLDEAFIYARDSAHLDFFGLSEYSYLLNDSNWEKIKDKSDFYNSEGSFVTIWGFEWRNDKYGHVGIFNSKEYCTDSETKTNNFSKLCEWLNLNNAEVFVILYHPGRHRSSKEFNQFNSEPCDKIVGIELWNRTDPFKIFYYNNGYYKDDNNKGYYDEALSRYWRLGAAGGGDNHNGTWGTQTNYRAAVLAKNLTRGEIIEAFLKRRFYSTLDKNLILYFSIDGKEMGDSVDSGNSIFDIFVSDKDKEMCEKIILYDSDHNIKKTWEPHNSEVNINEIINTKNNKYLYLKVTQADGDEAISSPIWIREKSIKNIPPVCKITSPSDGSVFYSPVTIEIVAEAKDSDGSIKMVRFFLNNKLIEGKKLEPYSLTLEFKEKGLYEIKALAFDDIGDSTWSDPINFEIIPTIKYHPICKIISPEDGESFFDTEEIKIEVSAKDTDGIVYFVELFCNDKSEGRDSVPPYNFSILKESGEYELKTIAVDNDGISSVSKSVKIDIKKREKRKISGKIISPKDGSIFFEPATILFDVKVDSIEFIKNIILFLNGEKIDSCKENCHQFILTDLKRGEYVFRAVIVTTDDIADTSLPIKVNIIGLNNPPTCSLLMVNGDYKILEGTDLLFETKATDSDGMVKIGKRNKNITERYQHTCVNISKKNETEIGKKNEIENQHQSKKTLRDNKKGHSFIIPFFLIFRKLLSKDDLTSL